LSRALRRCGLTGIFPAHVFFEFMSAIMDEDSRAGRPVRIALVESTPGIRFDTILLPLDAEFITKYIIEEFKANGPIKLRAGDLPFVAVARRNNLRLITEDTGMQREARRLGVDAFTIAEFLSAVRDAQKTSASRIE
jgi:predicted nucleic acid-binding protein